MAINYTDLFTRLCSIFKYQKSINTARGTTFPPLASDIIDEFDGETITIRQTIDSIYDADAQARTGLSAAMSAAQLAAQQVLIETVNADTTLRSKTLDNALAELIRQMKTDGESVAESGIAVDGSDPINGTSDNVLTATRLKGNGELIELPYPEFITLECTDDTTEAGTQFTAFSNPQVTDPLSELWPGGSGLSVTIPVSNSGNSLLTNSSFEDDDDRANTPNDWIVRNFTAGTSIKVTPIEVQQLAITGPPSAGYYEIQYTNAGGKVQTTGLLAYNATGAEVETALQALVGLEAVTVETTGTTPNYTHQITFTGVAGNVAALSSINSTTGGTLTWSTITSGPTLGFKGRALQLIGGTADVTELYQRIDQLLAPLNTYVFNLWAAASASIASGTLDIALVDSSSGGSVIDNEAGDPCSVSFNLANLTTSFAPLTFFFATPRIIPSVIYLQIKLSAALASGKTVYLDEAHLNIPVELYTDGPKVAIFNGIVPQHKGDALNPPSSFQLEVENLREGEIHEWFERNFGLRNRRFALPTDPSETISDSLMS